MTAPRTFSPSMAGERESGTEFLLMIGRMGWWQAILHLKGLSEKDLTRQVWTRVYSRCCELCSNPDAGSVCLCERILTSVVLCCSVGGRYFALGWAVVHTAPLAWGVVGLA
jgi:hypothetical protein